MMFIYFYHRTTHSSWTRRLSMVAKSGVLATVKKKEKVKRKEPKRRRLKLTNLAFNARSAEF